MIGLFHPGEMGAALASALRDRGRDVLWAAAGRGPETKARAERAGLVDVGSPEELAQRSGLILSVCPPHAAVDVARSVGRYDGVYVDMNAIAPATAREIARLVEAGGARYVDGAIIGPPPRAAGTTRLYLSGREAEVVAAVFAETIVATRVVSDGPGAASAVKMAYAACTKGSAALLLAARALARSEAVEDVLLDEWAESEPGLAEESVRAARSASSKGWRWAGEMREIAAAFASADLPAGFHEAAASIFERSPGPDGDETDAVTLERVLAALTATPRAER